MKFRQFNYYYNFQHLFEAIENYVRTLYNLKLNVIHLMDFLYFYEHIITCDLDDFPGERIEMLRIMRLTVCSIHPFLVGMNGIDCMCRML